MALTMTISIGVAGVIDNLFRRKSLPVHQSRHAATAQHQYEFSIGAPMRRAPMKINRPIYRCLSVTCHPASDKAGVMLTKI